MPAQGVSFDGTPVIQVPARSIENALRLGLPALRLKPRPIKRKCSLIEKLHEAFITQLGLLFLFSREFAIGQGNAAVPPIAPEKEFVILLLHPDFLVGAGRSIVEKSKRGICHSILTDGKVKIVRAAREISHKKLLF
jgi:hypothetical protein